SEADGILIYHSESEELPENRLSDSLSFTTPMDRLLHGFIDPAGDFNLRYRALLHQYQSRKSHIRGFIGGRISLIPHQLYVAETVAAIQIPRVLLSDETGLGKTIEVCLILHRLLINEQISRVLILLPNSLVNQWFIELIRKFNLVFRIFDEEYCESIVSSDPEANPFLEDQLGICSIEFLTSNPQWEKKAIEAGWDMLVIDEAHHLTVNSPSYNLAAALSKVSQGLMLLTATPEQLGHESHFARLQLLDPSRYHDFTLFEKEENQYLKISTMVNKLLEGGKLNKTEVAQLAAISSGSNSSLLKKDPSLPEKDESFRDNLIDDILDRFGTGRAIFRNTRTAMSGFPERIAGLVPLEGNTEILQQQTTEFKAGMDENQNKPAYNYNADPRLSWLVNLLQKLKKYKNQKVLLICQSIEKVKAIEDVLRKSIKTNIALFHEDLSLIQRDRNASWFAEQNGAQILLCSEIGSEGRNFQFAHHLVLFDLPFDPELLEQRIGRLDRIGQKHVIQIHVPFIIGSEFEMIAKWYHEGLNAFNENVSGSYQIFQKMGPQIKEIVQTKDFSKLKECIKETG
ncbi:MAG: RNA polymerase-associated protein RapA, partial [Calditrichia bacterium]|nr:RNA polymerase-associated protein RapA [Calditrichia bacterium]